MTEVRKTKLKAVLATAKEEFGRMVAEYVRTHSRMTFEECGKSIGISKAEVSALCKKHGVTRLRGNGSTAATKRVEAKHGK